MLPRKSNRVKAVLPLETATTLPLDSNGAFRYLLFNWQLLGMITPAKHRRLYYCYAVILNIFGPIFLPISLLMNLYFIDNKEELLKNISTSLTLVNSSLKQLAIFMKRSEWKRTAEYLRPLDARCATNSNDRKYVENGMRLCRIFYKVYMLGYFVCVVGLGAVGFTKHQLIYNGWFPSVLQNPEHNYLLSFIYQSVANIAAIPQNASNDMYPQCYVAVMIGHLRALAARIERIGYDKQRTLAENQQELQNCIQDYKNFMAFFNSLRSVISITMFLQFLITAFVLCSTAVTILYSQNELGQVIVSAFYAFAVLTELFPCCWFVNVLMHESMQLTNAMYNCNWYEQDQKFRKTLIIFMQRSQRTNVIMAGNMLPVTLQSFVATLKLSFSLFTVLSKTRI